jgi:hypothetical protein
MARGCGSWWCLAVWSWGGVTVLLGFACIVNDACRDYQSTISFLGATWGDLHAFEHDDIRSWRRQALAFVGDLSVSQLVETNEMQSLTLPSSTAFLAGSEWMMLVTVVGAAVATLMLPAGAKS